MQKINYETLMQNIINSLPKEKKPSLLLHSCCAPCSCAVIEFLMNYFEITIYFYNPNITDEEEYQKRLEEHQSYIKSNNLSIKFISGKYNPKEDFFEKVKGYENFPEGGDRCTICYRERMEQTAIFAKENKFDYFTTVLSISPLKNSDKINNIGRELEEKYQIKFLFADFKKKSRYLRGIEISRENDLYRQDFCGCVFSKRK